MEIFCRELFMVLVVAWTIPQQAYSINCVSYCQNRGKSLLSYHRPNNLRNVPRYLGNPYTQSFTKVITGSDKPHCQISESESGTIKSLSFVIADGIRGITIRSNEGTKKWYSSSRFSLSDGGINIMELLPDDDYLSDLCCLDERVLGVLGESGTSAWELINLQTFDYDESLARNDYDISYWSSSGALWLVNPAVEVFDFTASGQTPGNSPGTPYGIAPGNTPGGTPGKVSGNTGYGYGASDVDALQIVCNDASYGGFGCKNKYASFDAGFTVDLPDLCRSPEFVGVPAIPPMNRAGILGVNQYKSYGGGRGDRGMERDVDALLIQNPITSEFLSTDIDDDFNIDLDDYPDVPLPLSDLVRMRSGDFNITSEDLSENNLGYFQNSDIGNIHSPDQRFLSQHYLDGDNVNFALCSFHNRQNCLMQRNGGLRMVSLADWSEDEVKPGFVNKSPEELMEASEKLSRGGYGSIAVFKMASLNRPQPDWVHCTSRNIYFSPVPGTFCTQYTESNSLTGHSRTLTCKPGTAFDANSCACINPLNFNCLCL